MPAAWRKQVFVVVGLSAVALVLGMFAPVRASEPGQDPVSTTLQILLAESRYDEVAALARASIAEAPGEFGEDSVEEANLLDALVQALYRSGHAMDPEALEVIQRAIEIKETQLGHQSRGVATSLMQLGNLYISRGNNDGALTNYEQAVEILYELRRTTEEPVERDLAVILSNIGIVHKRRGDFDAALEVAERALTIRRDSLGADHPDLATSYNNIANVLIMLGRYDEARANNERALVIRETALGEDHELVAESLNNLSSVLGYMGEFDEALAAQERAVEIFAKVLGSDNERTWTVQFNLAVLESDMGDYAGAQQLYEEVLTKQRERFGDRNIELVETLDALAEAALAQGDPALARDDFEESLSIYEEQYGEGTDAADYTLQGLGRSLTELGDFERGREVLGRSLAIRESYGDSESPVLCEVLHALAELRLAEGSFDEAAALAKRSQTIIENRLGTWHPLMADALGILARANVARGHLAAGFEDALRADQTSRKHFRDTMSVLSECLALDYAANRVNGIDLALSVLDQVDSSEAASEAWDAVIRSRAMVFDEMARRKRATSDSGDPTLVSLLGQSRAAREQMANLSLRGPGWEDPATYKAMLDHARDEAKRLDRAIAVAAGDDPRPVSEDEIGLDQVRSQLGPDQALVAFVRYGQLPADPIDWSAARKINATTNGSYRAFVVCGDGSSPRSVALGDADAIDGLVELWRKQIETKTNVRSRGFSRVARDDDADFGRCMELGKDLRRMIWDPLREALGAKSQTVFVVPDGSLHLVSFGALVGEDGRFLIEKERRLWLLSAERSLVQDDAPPSVALPMSELGALLVIGDPDYGAIFPTATSDWPSGPASSSNPRPSRSEARDVVGSAARTNCLDAAQLRFVPLPGARREANEVASLWSSLSSGRSAVTLLEGAQASELAVKAALRRSEARPTVVHIATHGFFMADECDEGGMRRTNPLVLSGLAFAGADHWQDSSSGENDGLLTSEEFAALDLCGVDLAVLSACDTGLGEIRSRGEGVFGLRRALQIAGVRTVMMSLWSVGDEAGYHFMSTFYRNRFQDGRSMQEALRSTSLSLIDDARAQGLPPHPVDWAAFVAVGDWR